MDEKEVKIDEELNKEEQAPEEKPKAEKKPRTDKTAKLKKELDGVKKELKEKEEKIEEYKNDYLRARADYDNLKRRTETSNAQFYADGVAKAVTELLPIVDNLERAIEAEKEETPMKKGVELVLKQAMGAFEKLEVEAFAEAGEAFDPNLHNAVMQVAAEEGEESGVIKTVLLKGYKLSGKVIRHAMVQVTE